MGGDLWGILGSVRPLLLALVQIMNPICPLHSIHCQAPMMAAQHSPATALAIFFGELQICVATAAYLGYVGMVVNAYCTLPPLKMSWHRAASSLMMSMCSHKLSPCSMQ